LAENAQLRDKNKELAKNAHKRKAEDDVTAGSSKTLEQETFEDDTDKDLSLLDESLLSQDSCKSERDENSSPSKNDS
jgi:hypothetical protein